MTIRGEEDSPNAQAFCLHSHLGTLKLAHLLHQSSWQFTQISNALHCYHELNLTTFAIVEIVEFYTPQYSLQFNS